MTHYSAGTLKLWLVEATGVELQRERFFTSKANPEKLWVYNGEILAEIVEQGKANLERGKQRK